MPVQVLHSSVATPFKSIRDAFIVALLEARESVWIQTPYFIPDEPLLNAMRTAALAGTDVRLMTVGVPDKKLVLWAAHPYYRQILESGVRVFQYTAGFLHAKTVTVDGRWCVIGTCNWDIRSLILHEEVSCAFYDEAFARRARRGLPGGPAVLPRVHARRLAGAERRRARAQLVPAPVLTPALNRAPMSPQTDLPCVDGRRGVRRVRPKRPVLLCNPWSGGGKVEQFGLKATADELGVETVFLDKGLDLAELALGVYGTIVQHESYRDAKLETTMRMLPELLSREAEPFDLQFATPDGAEIESSFVVQVSNNPYVWTPSPEFAQRSTMDSGKLGVFAVNAGNGREAAEIVEAGVDRSPAARRVLPRVHRRERSRCARGAARPLPASTGRPSSLKRRSSSVSTREACACWSPRMS